MNDRLFHVAAVPFEAARRVAILPEGHRARRLHGHSFWARVRAELPADWAPFPGGETEPLRQALATAVAPLDYADLNAHLAVPTDENLARWVRDRLAPQDGGYAGRAGSSAQRAPQDGGYAGRAGAAQGRGSVPGGRSQEGRVAGERPFAIEPSGAQFAIPGIESVGIQSTRDEGADLDGGGQVHLWRRFRFESAHRLPRVPDGHPCGRMHGHGFEVILHALLPAPASRDASPSLCVADQELTGPNIEFDRGLDCDQIGDQIGALWTPLHAELDHACLNDIPGLENPTSEVLSHWLWDRLKPELPALSWVTVYETATAGCHFDGTHYRIWKERRFESALRLALAPEGDPRRRLHGHSYLLRLHLTAPLDDVLGWTVDYGDVKALFQPVYRRLDHHRLDELADLADPDPGRLTLWMRAALAGALPALDRIDLHQTPGCGAVLCWGDLGPALPT